MIDEKKIFFFLNTQLLTFHKNGNNSSSDFNSVCGGQKDLGEVSFWSHVEVRVRAERDQAPPTCTCLL